MISILKDILPYISGLYTLPWILVGFVTTILIARVIGREKIDKIMKKIGLILLYFFIPLLVFRVFLDLFETSEIFFVILVLIVIFFMYFIAFVYAKHYADKQGLKDAKRNLYIKTVLTNQGRSSAFIGSAMMAYWPIEAGIVIALVGIALFAIIPYVLAHIHKKESEKNGNTGGIKALPWYLKLYPWYLIIFVISAIIINIKTGITTESLGDLGIFLKFYTAITIPAALYYVGAGIHPRDLKISELKKLFGLDRSDENVEHWTWVRSIFILTVIITPFIFAIIFTPLLVLEIIPSSWFAVIIINSVLPITSTNMFLLPYEIDRKTTAYAITWTTLICVPVVLFLIIIFNIYL